MSGIAEWDDYGKRIVCDLCGEGWSPAHKCGPRNACERCGKADASGASCGNCEACSRKWPCPDADWCWECNNNFDPTEREMRDDEY